MTSKRSKLQEDTHFRVLRLLQDNSEMSQRELAEAVGISELCAILGDTA